jgi:hypothetical protein
LEEGDDIESYFDDVGLDPAASNISKIADVQTSEVDAKLTLVNTGP